MASSRIFFSNGVVLHSPDAPSASTFLESQPGAYTTTRTHNGGSGLLFWERHVQRLANSARILFYSNPQLLFKSCKSTSSTWRPPPISPQVWESAIGALVGDSMSKTLPIAAALRKRCDQEELAITALVSGELERWSDLVSVNEESLLDALEVHLHVGNCIPPAFGNGACLAAMGPGRDVAQAKYSDWVRLRKPLERLRPASVTELLLSNDGDQLLEGCVTNFFVVCRKDNNEVGEKYIQGFKSWCPFEVQTAPVSVGVLPGVIRQLVIEVCLKKGIPLREVAPSWSSNGCWEEAFITNSLRIIQHVEKIQVPSPWKSLDLKPPEEILWDEKQFGEDPGMITAIIQREILEMASLEAYFV